MVTNKEEVFGRKTKYLLTHPEIFLFVSEVGDNTSQKNDGNVMEGNSLPFTSTNISHSSDCSMLRATLLFLDLCLP